MLRARSSMVSISCLLLVGAATLHANPQDRLTNSKPVPPTQYAKGEQPAYPIRGGCVDIPDDGYDGSIGSMACINVPGVSGTVTDVNLEISANHTWVGDLTVKVVSPSSTQTTMSRPGDVEPADDGSTPPFGNSSDLVVAFPIIYDDAASTDAEIMGDSGAGVVCQDDGLCNYFSNSGSAGGAGLTAFNGENGAGTWQVCVGDSAAADTGQLCSASLVFNGQASDLSVAIDAPGGVADGGGAFEYSVDVTNNGPSDNTGVMATVNLPAGVTYVSDTCGGSAAGSVWSWAVGNLAASASASCSITVNAPASCTGLVATASVSGDLSDSDNTNNSASHTNVNEAVADGGFEGGTPNADWNEASTNFGTPLCTVGTCGTGTGTGPRSGDFWAWFGGISTTETGSVSQSIVIPAGTANLTFWVEAIICDSPADFLEASIDGNVVWSINGSDAICGQLGYTQITVDVSSFADDGTHTLSFDSTIFANNGGGSNFFLDDVSLGGVTCDAAPIDPLAIPTMGEWGLLLMLLGLAGAGVVFLRRS